MSKYWVFSDPYFPVLEWIRRFTPQNSVQIRENTFHTVTLSLPILLSLSYYYQYYHHYFYINRESRCIKQLSYYELLMYWLIAITTNICVFMVVRNCLWFIIFTILLEASLLDSILCSIFQSLMIAFFILFPSFMQFIC